MILGTRIMVVIGFVLVMIPNIHAQEWADWCEADPAKGWHFYCDATEEEEVSLPATDAESSPDPLPDQTALPSAPPTARERLGQLQETIEEARALAVLEPTEANIEAYIRLQEKVLVQSVQFADTWRRLVWQNPDLDYEGQHPQTHLGKQAARTELAALQKETLAELRETHALIYIGSSHCPVCRVYGPNLRRFAENNLFTVLAISIDGSPLHGWEGAGVDEGQLARLGIETDRIPLTLLYQRATDQVTILGVGYLADDEISHRIHTLVKMEVGDAF